MAQQQGNRSIKILSVVWYQVLPARFGGQKAVALFNQYLSLHASLVCLCSNNNKVVDTSYHIEPKLPVGKSQFLNPFVWATIYRFAKREGITHLILEFPYHGIAAFICKKLLRIKVVLNTHNIEFSRFKEQGKWWWRLLYYYEKWTMKESDLVFFKTAADQEKAVKVFGLSTDKVDVVPYGTEKKNLITKMYYKAVIHEKYNIEDKEKVLLFAGTLDYAPNAEAVKLISEKLVPLLNALHFSYRIIICGRNKVKAYRYLQQIKNSHIIFAGEVENMNFYFEAADVFINPVITGGGIQTKIIEALSYDLNVVCFDEKTVGIHHGDNKIFNVESGNWPAFANAAVKALAVNEPTSEAFFINYDWHTIAASAYEKIASC